MAASSEMLLIITNPPGVDHRAGFSPIEMDDPSALVFCAFFRTTEARSEFLQRLRQIASAPATGETNTEQRHDELSAKWDLRVTAGDYEGAIYALAEWWVSVKRHGYHAYSLRVEFPPYRTSCLIAFEELDANSIRQNVAQALHFAETRRDRVLDAFGLTGGLSG